MGRRTGITIACVLLASCGGDAPRPATPASVDPATPASVKPLKGNERLAWDQMAATAAEAALIRVVIYIDDVRADMQDVSCGTTPTSAGYACSGRLPPMRPGPHTLKLASLTADGSKQSILSESLRVVVGPP